MTMDFNLSSNLSTEINIYCQLFMSSRNFALFSTVSQINSFYCDLGRMFCSPALWLAHLLPASLTYILSVVARFLKGKHSHNPNLIWRTKGEKSILVLAHLNASVLHDNHCVKVPYSEACYDCSWNGWALYIPLILKGVNVCVFPQLTRMNLLILPLFHCDTPYSIWPSNHLRFLYSWSLDPCFDFTSFAWIEPVILLFFPPVSLCWFFSHVICALWVLMGWE